jgi:hypothetical protein
LNKVGQVAEFIDYNTFIKVVHDNGSKDEDSANDARLCLRTSYFESNNANTSQKPEENLTSPDDRIITADQLRTKVCENNICSLQQQEKLYGELIK